MGRGCAREPCRCRSPRHTCFSNPVAGWSASSSRGNTSAGTENAPTHRTARQITKKDKMSCTMRNNWSNLKTSPKRVQYETTKDSITCRLFFADSVDLTIHRIFCKKGVWVLCVGDSTRDSTRTLYKWASETLPATVLVPRLATASFSWLSYEFDSHAELKIRLTCAKQLCLSLDRKLSSVMRSVLRTCVLIIHYCQEPKWAHILMQSDRISAICNASCVNV